MLFYSELKDKIRKSRAGRPRIDNNTWAQFASNGRDIEIILHHTAVVIVRPDGNFEINSGGWQTLTTKNRINKFSPAVVFQRKWEWFVGEKGVPFRDGMVVNSKGTPIPAPPRPFSVTYASVDVSPELRP